MAHPSLPALLRRVARPAAELTAAALGLLCCMATSDVDEPLPDDEPPPGTETGDAPPPADFTADVVLHNATDIDQVVRLRSLRPAVDLDCTAIAERPGELLTEALFAPVESWTMPPGTNLPVVAASLPSRECWATWIEADALPPAIAFWFAGSPPQTSWPTTGLIENVGLLLLGQAGEGAPLQLEDRAGGLLWAPAEAAPPTDACALVDDSSRVAWSAPVPTGAFTLEAFVVGLDGCLSLDLVGDLPEQPPPWYLCVAPEAFPFAVGDAIAIDNVYDTGVEGVRVRALEGTARELVVTRGSAAPALLDLQWSGIAEPLAGCDLALEAACGSVSRAAALRVASPTFGAGEVRSGGPALELLAADGRRVRIESAVVQDRAALDPECAPGPDVLGPDVELVITILEE
jgi:hypothetical protein